MTMTIDSAAPVGSGPATGAHAGDGEVAAAPFPAGGQLAFNRGYFLRLTAAQAPAQPVPPPELVGTPTAGAKMIGASVTVGSSEAGRLPSTADFAGAILDGDRYPLTGEFCPKVLFVTLPCSKVLIECRTLGVRDGYTILYQRTGGGAGISPRHYVIALRVTEDDGNRVKIEWKLVRHRQDSSGKFAGPFADALNRHPDHVYTPYNSGSWTYDRAARSIRYEVATDSGGSLPDWMISKDAVLAFPKKFLEERYGIGGLK